MALETLDNENDRRNEIDRFVKRQRIGLVVFAVLLSAAWFYLTIVPERPGETLMSFTFAEPTRQAALCPGETLDYDITLDVTEPGVFEVIVAVWRVSPPAVVVWEERPRLVPFTEPMTYSLKRSWVIPSTHPDPSTGLPVPWQPGEYERRHAIVTISRSTEPSIVSVPFTVRSNCE